MELPLFFLEIMLWTQLFMAAGSMTDTIRISTVIQVENSTSNDSWSQFISIIRSNDSSFAAGFSRNFRGNYVFSIVAVPKNLSKSAYESDTVWSANRNTPVEETSTLTIEKSGMILKRPNGSIAWKTEISSSSDAASLQLKSSGNLALLDGKENIIWQSFDHPSDTLLEGQNLTKGTRLISSVSQTDPSEGSYSLTLGTDRLILYATFVAQQSENYWEWVPLQELAQIKPEKGPIYARVENGYLAIYQSEKDKVDLMTFNSFNKLENDPIRRARLDYDGNLRVYYWNKSTWVQDYEALKDACDYPNGCGAYGVCSNNGQCLCPDAVATSDTNASTKITFANSSYSQMNNNCTPVSPPQLCSGGVSEDQFLEIAEIDYFANQYSTPLNVSSAEECRTHCLQNCSCLAYFFHNDSTRKCYHTGQLRTMKRVTNSADLAFIRVKNPLQITGKNRESASTSYIKKVAISLGVVALFIFALLALLCPRFCKRYNKHKGSEDDAFLRSNSLHLPRRFTYHELQIATNFFQNRLDGRNSSLFEGILPDETKITVKKLEGVLVSERTFGKDIASLAWLRHTNLLSILGFCIEKNCHYMLVYEHCKSSIMTLKKSSLNEKYKAMVEVAEALKYLHEESFEPTPHGNLQPGQILLDDIQMIRVCGYGEWKLYQRGQRQESDLSYMAPEVRANSENISAKSDVYSFGLILLEMATNRNDFEVLLQEIRQGDPEKFADTYQDEEVKKMIRVGAWCSREELHRRPSIATILEALSQRSGAEHASLCVEGK